MPHYKNIDNEPLHFSGNITIEDYSNVVFNKKVTAVEGFVFSKEAKFKNARFKKGADFKGVIFKEEADFEGAIFREEADFEGAVFEMGVYFRGSYFCGKVNFRYCKFFDFAVFWRARFAVGKEMDSKEEKDYMADFRNIVVRPAETKTTHAAETRTSPTETRTSPTETRTSPIESKIGPVEVKKGPAETQNGRHRRQSGEANFSWALFKHGANFERSHFYGPTHFWRTVFYNKAIFSNVKFDANVTFRGVENEVCFARRDFEKNQNPEGISIFNNLCSFKMQSEKEGDSGEIFRIEDYEGKDYGYFDLEKVTIDKPAGNGFKIKLKETNVKKTKVKESELEKIGLKFNELKEIEKIWEPSAKPMFYNKKAEDKKAEGDCTFSFQNVVFGKPEHSKFIKVNLESCYFEGANLEKVVFIQVAWYELPMGLMGKFFVRPDKQGQLGKSAIMEFIKRRAVYDENEYWKHKDPEAIGRLYTDLRINYQSKGHSKQAGDFHYGEMKMQKPNPITWLYKLLSGYGENYMVALLLLIFFIGALFPLWYFHSTTGGYDITTGGYVKSLLHSLEVSTFLEKNSKDTITSPQKDSLYLRLISDRNVKDTAASKQEDSLYGLNSYDTASNQKDILYLRVSTDTNLKDTSTSAAGESNAKNIQVIAIKMNSKDAATSTAKKTDKIRYIEAIQRIIIAMQLSLFIIALRRQLGQ